MAAGADITGEAVIQVPDVQQSASKTETAKANSESKEMSADGDSKSFDSNINSKLQMQDIVTMLKKLNPMAKEFFPASYGHDRNQDQLSANNFIDGFPNNRKKRNNFKQGKRRMNGRMYRGQREDSVRRTVYVSDVDSSVTEERLAALFSGYGQVLDCRVCGDQHSRLRFAFVEFADEYSARAALNLCGTVVGLSPVKVLPSKTAILPVNPSFLPRSEDEREMCSRTVYCTNIDKKVSEADVKEFFEHRCGEVSRLRLLGDQLHSTRIAFVEFVMADSAIAALDCCGEQLGSQRIRVSPSKTPVRPQAPRPLVHGLYPE